MQVISFNPSAIKTDKNIWIIDIGTLPLPKSFQTALAPHIVYLKPGGWAGDHTHARQEAVVGLSQDLFLVWRDEDGQRHEQQMMKDGQLYLFVVPPFLPHLAENRSKHEAVIYELIDRDDDQTTPLSTIESLRIF